MNNFGNGAGYFLYVGDISEVYNYMVPQGQTMFFMHREQPLLFIKSVNMFNQQTVSIYDLVERKQEMPQIQPQPQPQQVTPSSGNDYVTRDELTTLIAETIRTELRNGKTKYYNNNKKEES